MQRFGLGQALPAVLPTAGRPAALRPAMARPLPVTPADMAVGVAGGTMPPIRRGPTRGPSPSTQTSPFGAAGALAPAFSVADTRQQSISVAKARGGAQGALTQHQGRVHFPEIQLYDESGEDAWGAGV